MPEVYLIGVNHADQKGPRRLERLLDAIKPTIITLEHDSKRHYDYIEQHRMYEAMGILPLRGIAREILSQGGQRAVNVETYANEMLINGFESWMSRRWARRHKATIIPLGNPSIRADTRPGSSEDFFQPFRESPIDFQRTIDDEYRAFTDETKDPYVVPSDYLRDADAAGQILALNGAIVHIGGLAHIYGHDRELAQRLAHINPKRLKLIYGEDTELHFD